MIEPAAARAGIEGEDGIRGERTKTHGGNIEYAGLIGLRAVLAAHLHPEIVVLERAGSQ